MRKLAIISFACLTQPRAFAQDLADYSLSSITPNRGTRAGGSRVTLRGAGFRTNFVSSGNHVFIGSDSTEWQRCDVIEAVCSVQCSGPNTLICDTRPWTHGPPLSDSGWLDVKVMIESYNEDGAGDMITLRLSQVYYYYGIANRYTPMLLSVTPRAASSEEALTITGTNIGYWMQVFSLLLLS